MKSSKIIKLLELSTKEYQSILKKHQTLKDKLKDSLISECGFKVGDKVKVIKDNYGRMKESVGFIGEVTGYFFCGDRLSIKINYCDPSYGYAVSFDSDELIKIK